MNNTEKKRIGDKAIVNTPVVKLCGRCSDQPQDVESMRSRFVVVHGCITG